MLLVRRSVGNDRVGSGVVRVVKVGLRCGWLRRRFGLRGVLRVRRSHVGLIFRRVSICILHSPRSRSAHLGNGVIGLWWERGVPVGRETWWGVVAIVWSVLTRVCLLMVLLMLREVLRWVHV